MTSCSVVESAAIQLMACYIGVRNSSALVTYTDPALQSLVGITGEAYLPSYSTLWSQWPTSDIRPGPSDPAVDAVWTSHICKSGPSDYKHLLYRSENSSMHVLTISPMTMPFHQATHVFLNLVAPALMCPLMCLQYWKSKYFFVCPGLK